MTPTPSAPVVRVRVRDPKTRDGHPSGYVITDAAELAEVLAVWPAEPAPAPETGPETGWETGFGCMCRDRGAAPLDDPGDLSVRLVPQDRPEALARLLDPRSPDGIPARHRARWAAAAPEPLRVYAEALARGEDPAPAGLPPAAAFSWQGSVREGPGDAAWLLAELAPQRLLAGASTGELARAVLETDRAGLDEAVRFFASEEFTTRHPKHRRVPDTARELLLRHARSHRPADLPVLERRLLRVPADRVRRS
ncbi:hypothetical protein ACODT3_08130 [Streptomyces sp. 4.24]|uniref:hypothetical protein n=1 Tax=Streptomyces tritrimontium TaxID=3406573 RepID=UPI003BB64F63